MECENIKFCLFLKKYPDENEYWYYKYCGNIKLSKRCERLKWCNCKGAEYPPVNYQPDGRKHN